MMLITKNMNTQIIQMKNIPMGIMQEKTNDTDLIDNPNTKFKYQIQMTARFPLEMTDLTDYPNTNFK
jgi:hypothetical protein